MDLALQGSLLDLGDAMTLGDLPGSLRRMELGPGAWVDVRPGWLVAGDELFATLVRDVPWRAERRKMYDNVVDVPRLTKFYDRGERLPHPILESARDALSRHYREELGEPFVTAGMCLYRDGRDSVAWHGDRIGRSKDLDTIVAILSLGSSRTLALRPRDGGPIPGSRQKSLRFPLGHGDLVVMGGSCQRTWDHSIPKTSEPVGPRISVQFRVAGVR
ncbi:MAG TPA: alpha-ketoglutarate-dependent dioxygenase AlkB [Intrasporangium sp.]|uniref:alpha-ketoglutarate-dependent dioxygenase AlkB n=1 Tax=Intrasporangium sp. TaxID=1925024 RepID=UPI002B4A5940|nr:alpha-ketoglutarate-dependent dioxygenase AlkB [Intrasporangium sp.]HKX67447.1 alpha-ketoglutarate-dependent dioxygenase AlkB [Intrasporangium sp.]